MQFDNGPLRAPNANVGSLTMVFADIRNPMSSFSILDRVLQASPPTQSIHGTEVQALVAHLSALGQELAQLLDELFRLRTRFTHAT